MSNELCHQMHIGNCILKQFEHSHNGSKWDNQLVRVAWEKCSHFSVQCICKESARKKSGGGGSRRRIRRNLKSQGLADVEKVGKKFGFRTFDGEKCERVECRRIQRARARHAKKANFCLRWLRRSRRRFLFIYSGKSTHKHKRIKMYMRRLEKSHCVRLTRIGMRSFRYFPYAICDRFVVVDLVVVLCGAPFGEVYSEWL